MQVLEEKSTNVGDVQIGSMLGLFKEHVEGAGIRADKDFLNQIDDIVRAAQSRDRTRLVLKIVVFL